MEQSSDMIEINAQPELSGQASNRQAPDAARGQAPDAARGQAWFHMLVESLHDGVVIVEGGHVVFVNDRLAAILGYSKEQLLHMSTLDFAAPEERERLARDMRAAGHKGEPLLVEFWAVREDGVRRYLRCRYSLVRSGDEFNSAFIVVSDITESKLVEESLHEQQSFLRQIIDLNPSLIFVKDRDSRFVLGNRALAQIYGTTVDGLIGKSDADFNPDPAQVEQFHLDDLRVMDSLQESVMPDRPLTDAQGKLHWVQAIKRPLVDADGVARHVLAVSVDITERKNLEQQIRDSLARRGQQVQTSTEVAQEIAAAPALPDLYQRVVTLIKERFGYYHAQIFRYEPAVDALVMVSGYGEPGRILLGLGHRLPVGRGVVGAAAAMRRAVLASDVKRDTDWVPNPHLPATKGELAVPIILRDQVLGILDVQSDTVGALTVDDQVLLEGLCGQIAIAIDSTRLRQEMEESLYELERVYRAMSQTGWETLQRETGLSGYVYDLVTVAPIADQPEPGAAPAAEQQPETEQQAAAEQPLPGAWAADGHAAVIAPLAVRGQVIGSLGIQQDPDHPLSAEDQALLESIAEQVARAMESARLFEQTQQALAETQSLYAATRRLTAATDLQEIVAAVAEGSPARAFNRVVLWSIEWNEAGELVGFTSLGNWYSGQGTPPLPVGVHFSVADFPVMGLVSTEEPVLLDDVTHNERLDPATRAVFQRQNIGSIVLLPLGIGTRQIGSLMLVAEEPHAFTESEIRPYRLLVGQMAVAVENRRLLEQTRLRAEELLVLNEMSRNLTMLTNEDAVIDSLYQHAARLLDATNLYVAFYDAQHDRVTFPLYVEGEKVRRHSGGRRAGNGMTEYVIRTRTPLLLKSDVNRHLAELGIEVIGQESQSWLGVPVIMGESVLGVIVVQSYTTPYVYAEHHRDLLNAIASQAAVALENVRLMEETRRRAEREHAVRTITDRVRRGTDREAIMRIALQELSQVLGAGTSVARLGTRDQLLTMVEGEPRVEQDPG